MSSGGTWLAVGAFLCALAVIAGAFGAHGLEARLDARHLALWETAARYAIYGGFGLIAIGLAGLAAPSLAVAGPAIVLLAGTLVFSGTVAALALGAPGRLGAVTPIGGLLMIAGFLWLGVLALRL